MDTARTDNDHVPSGESIRLLVYGTMMRGQRDHDLLLACRYIGNATIVFDPGSRLLIRGEVYDVPGHAIEALDEQAASHRRVEVTVVDADDANLIGTRVHAYRWTSDNAFAKGQKDA